MFKVSCIGLLTRERKYTSRKQHRSKYHFSNRVKLRGSIDVTLSLQVTYSMCIRYESMGIDIVISKWVIGMTMVVTCTFITTDCILVVYVARRRYRRAANWAHTSIITIVIVVVVMVMMMAVVAMAQKMSNLVHIFSFDLI